MDEGWTRWVLEQYEFNLTSLHNADIRAGKLRQKFDAIILADQNAARHRRRRSTRRAIRPEYRGGIGDDGRRQPEAVRRRRRHARHDGRTRATSRSRSCRFRCSNLKTGLTRDQHFAPGTILRRRGRHAASARLRHGGRHLRLLHQQPVLHARSRASRRRSRRVVARYPNTERDRVGLAEGRGADGRPRRGRRRST